MNALAYSDFLQAKRHEGADCGFEPVYIPDFLFDFQQHMTAWAIRKGRAALFADCGLGKTPMQLVWAENILRKTNRAVLILAPLAVSYQTVREAEKFGIECHQSKGGAAKGIIVTNYEQLDKFDPSAFAGVVCDESSILKSFDGARRNQITNFMRKVPYRLLATATAAPNDYMELGTSSEALGHLGHMDMLGRFFINNSNNVQGRRMYGEAPEFRFKGHAEIPFWRWVCSWALAMRKPSDCEFDDNGFILPPLREVRRQVNGNPIDRGLLFDIPAINLREQRADLKATMHQRCEKVAELVKTDQFALVWCQLNAEGELLANLIPDAVQISGNDSDEAKQERFEAFTAGQTRVLITKPKIGAWGLNFQHCAHVVYFPSHSYEQYYQAVRRCWRFGQTRPVTVDIVLTEGQQRVMDNLQRKSEAATLMFERLVKHMKDAQGISSGVRHSQTVEVPAWM